VCECSNAFRIELDDLRVAPFVLRMAVVALLALYLGIAPVKPLDAATSSRTAGVARKAELRLDSACRSTRGSSRTCPRSTRAPDHTPRITRLLSVNAAHGEANATRARRRRAAFPLGLPPVPPASSLEVVHGKHVNAHRYAIGSRKTADARRCHSANRRLVRRELGNASNLAQMPRERSRA